MFLLGKYTMSSFTLRREDREILQNPEEQLCKKVP